MFSYYWKRFCWTLVYSLPEREITLETENGLLSFSNKDWLIGKTLFIHRSYEIELIDSVIEFLEKEGLLKNREIVCDIGANLGMISIALLKKYGFMGALAFEPSPKSFRFLMGNAEQNGFADRMKCFQIALSSADGEFLLEIAEGNSGDNRIRTTSASGKLGEEKRRTIPIKAKTFDSFLQEQKISDDEISLIWIDAQGHEGHFFLGAKAFFKRRKVPVMSEFWAYGIERSGISGSEYCSILAQTFSRFYLLTDKGFELKSISEIEGLFKTGHDPRKIGSLILY
jgi:FkbM family methyltransferase